jgi:hypothetical protein
MATRHWTGGAGTTDWFTAGNWNGHHVPTNADSAVLNSGAVVVANGLTNANKPGITTVNVGAHLTVQSSVYGFAFGCTSVAGTVISDKVIITGQGDAESLGIVGVLRFIGAYHFINYSYTADNGALIEFTNSAQVSGEGIQANSGGTVNFKGGSFYMKYGGAIITYGTGSINFTEGSYIRFDGYEDLSQALGGRITFDEASLRKQIGTGNTSAVLKFPRNFGLGKL